MRTLLLFLSLLLYGGHSFAQSCHGPATEAAQKTTEAFADLANDPAFVAEHDDPLALEFNGRKGKTVTFKASDGQPATGYLVKARKKSDRYLFVIHEWWGLNAHIRQEAHQWAERLEGVNVVALDLYDGKVATTREEAGKLMQAVKAERAVAIVQGALAYAGPDASVATIGWCFGGGWSLQASLLAGKQAAGCVMYYGMPEKDVARLQALETDVLAIFASQDQWINEQVANEFRANMASAGKSLELLTYDAAHAFANPSNPVYDKEKADDANAKALAYLKARFGL